MDSLDYNPSPHSNLTLYIGDIPSNFPEEDFPKLFNGFEGFRGCRTKKDKNNKFVTHFSIELIQIRQNSTIGFVEFDDFRTGEIAFQRLNVSEHCPLIVLNVFLGSQIISKSRKRFK
jgi:RNA recognition motif-containing protein